MPSGVAAALTPSLRKGFSSRRERPSEIGASVVVPITPAIRSFTVRKAFPAILPGARQVHLERGSASLHLV